MHVKIPPWDEKKAWVVIDHGDGLKHYYRQSSITAIIDPRNDSLNQKTMIVVGGRDYYVPMRAKELAQQLIKSGGQQVK